MQLELPPVRKKRLVSMTPLIDVVFILLLFFMLASNFQQWRALPLNLAGQTDNQADLDPLFNVHIGLGGNLTLDNTPLDLEKLTAMLEREVADGADPRVLVYSNEATDLQTLVQVIDRIAATGINRITLGGANP